MNLKKNIILSIICTLFVVTSCYEDTGNYDLTDLVRVAGIESVEDVYSVVKYDSELFIDPVIVLNDTTIQDRELEYEWKLEYFGRTIEDELYKGEKILSNEKILNVVIDDVLIPFGETFASLKVTDPLTGIEFRKKFTVDVLSPFSKGDYFLYELGDDSELLYVNLDEKILPGAFYKMTGSELYGNPLAIGEVFLGSANDMVIYTNQAPDYGAVVSLNHFNYKAPAIATFFDKMPIDFDYQDSKFSSWLLDKSTKMLIGSNYYYYNSTSAASIKPQINLDIPTLTDIDGMSHLPENSTVLHQESTGFIFYHKWRGYSSTASVNPYGIGSHIPSLATSYPGKCIFIGKEPGTNQGYSMRILLDDQGVIKEYDLNGVSNFPWSSLTLKQGGAPKVITWGHLIGENTLWEQSRSTRYFYFTNGNIVYRYNYDSTAPDYEPEEFITLPAGCEITYLHMDGVLNMNTETENTQLIVACYQPGDENSGSAYYYTPEGELIKSYENQCGKIVGRLNRP